MVQPQQKQQLIDTQRSSSRLVLCVAGAAATTLALCWMLGRSKISSSKAGRSKLSIEERRAKIAEAAERFGSMFPKVPVLSAAEAHALLQQQPEQYVVVDCRNKEEQQVSMLAGSRVLTTAEYEQQQESLRDATAICYCTVGYRSSQFAQGLLDKGIKAVNMRGGIVAYTQEGLPLVDGSSRQQPTNRVHTYSAGWAYQADGYQPVYYRNSKFVMVRDVLSSIKRALTSGSALR